MFKARILRPAPSSLPLIQPSLRTILDSSLTVVAAATNFIVDENVARVLHDRDLLGRTAWLRLDSPDVHPDYLVRSLEDAVGAVHGEPIQVLAALSSLDPTLSHEFCRALGDELARHTPPGATIVIENARATTDACALINILVGWCRSSRDRHAVLLWHGRLPRRARRVGAKILDANQLAVDASSVREIAAIGPDGLTPRATARLLRMASGHAALTHDVLDGAMRDHETSTLEEMLGASVRAQTFMSRLTTHMLSRCSPDEREAIRLAMDLGYWHPSMDGRRLGGEGPRWPWFAQLDGGWWRLRVLWSPILRRHVELAARHRFTGVIAARVPSRYEQPGPLQRHVVASTRMIEPVDASSELTASHRPDRSVTTMKRSIAQATSLHDVGSCDGHTVSVRLLGRFEVAIDGRPVDAWHSPRGLMLFKYLLTHRDHPCARDVLMDVFWPDVAPDRARNRFHVTLSALRRSIRAVADIPVVVFRESAYGLNPDLDLQVDVDEFRRLVETGDRALREIDTDMAIVCYERATTLYRGDLLADTPYDDWALLPRETLRVTYLDVLDNLAALYLATERYGQCVAIAQLILQQDPCREDAHRLLMRCYVQQGRRHQALRQFDLCSRTLEMRLGAGPSRATVELYRSLRASRAG